MRALRYWISTLINGFTPLWITFRTTDQTFYRWWTMLKQSSLMSLQACHSMSWNWDRPHVYTFTERTVHSLLTLKIAENLRFYNLYDKLIISLQDTVKINLRSYSDNLEMLCDDAAMLNDENKRISAHWIQEKKDHTPAVVLNTSNSTFEAFWHTASPLIRKQEAAVLTPLCIKVKITDFIPLKPITCFNCSKVEHFASSCPESRRLSEVKEIEGGEEDNEQSGKEDT